MFNMAFVILFSALMLFISNSDAKIVFCDFTNIGGCFTDTQQPIRCFNLRQEYVTFLRVQKIYNINHIRTAGFNPNNYMFFRVVQKFEMPPSAVQVYPKRSPSSVSKKPITPSIRSVTPRTNINEQQIQRGLGLFGSWCISGGDISPKQESRLMNAGGVRCYPVR